MFGTKNGWWEWPEDGVSTPKSSGLYHAWLPAPMPVTRVVVSWVLNAWQLGSLYVLLVHVICGRSCFAWVRPKGREREENESSARLGQERKREESERKLSRRPPLASMVVVRQREKR